jgi:hypothetical protein
VTIVTARPPRRKPPKPSKPPQPMDTPRVFQHPPKWQRERKPVPRDPEAEARVIAFFRRMVLTVPDDIFEP